jgi:carbonic anhydrase/acetyltransferase-like protein (isoleucine patch superfamily)
MNRPAPGAGSAPLLIAFKGRAPRVAADAFVAPGAVLIGDVELGPRASVWFGCVLRGDVGPIRVGARSNLQDGTVVHVDSDAEPTIIGDAVTVGHQALLHACRLEDGSFVGMRATVMDGAVVEGGAMVAAGALLTPGKRVRRGELWAGTPAKCIRELRPQELASFVDTVEHYASLGAEYEAILAGR